MKRFLLLLLCAALLACAGCAPKEKTAGVTVIATLFPTYDFAKAVAGDLASVTLLLPPGVESHSFEPSPTNVAAISKASVFIYTGDSMEPWAADLLAGTDPGVVVDASAGLTLDMLTYDAEAHALEGHDEYDPHIWTDPTMAVTMVGNIADGLCKADPGNADVYRANAKVYNEKLLQLDADMAEMIQGSKRQEICFGGRFAMHYFAKRYGLSYIAAYDSCSEETEPSAKAVAMITDRIREDGLPAIYYEELVDPQVANAIAAETGARALLLHSCHNVSQAELDAGATYLTLMYKNLENLRVGLN